MNEQKVINGHVYEFRFEGRSVYYVDYKRYYNIPDAAAALGLTVGEFLKAAGDDM